MAFDFFGQNSLGNQQNSQNITTEQALNFRPTLANGQLMPPSRVNVPTPQDVLNSAKTGVPLPPMYKSNNPLTTSSSLGKLLMQNGMNLPDVDVALKDPKDELQKAQAKKKGDKIDYNALFDKLNQTVATPTADPFEQFKQKEGNFRSWNVDINQNLTRYEKSGDKVNAIPFSPYRNNEKLYKERMSNWDDTRRAFSGFWETAKLGIYDSIGIGSMIDTDASDVFDMANKLGSSSKEGTIGFINNMIVSAGYTGGILMEIAAESAAMMGIEALAGLTAAPTGGASVAAGIAGGAAMVGDIANKVNKLKKAITSLSKSSTWKKVGSSALEAINPLDDVMKFRKDLSVGGKLQQANNWQKAAGYTTNAWRGFNKIKFAYEESAMEAGTTFNETRRKAIDQYYQENGRMPSNAEIDRIDDLARGAAYTTFAENMPTIYLSNAFVFDDLLRPRKWTKALGRGKASETGSSIITTRGTMANGKKGRIATAVPEDFFGKTKALWKNPKLAGQMFGNGVTRYIAENTVEGAQEVLQDWYQTASQQQFEDKYKGNTSKGAWYNYLTSNAGSMFTEQGLENFASGFLMQMLISPIAKGSAFVSSGFDSRALGNGPVASLLKKPSKQISDRLSHQKEIKEAGGYQKWLDKEEAKAKREWEDTHKDSEGKITKPYRNAKEKLEDDVAMLNDYFQDPLKYLNPMASDAIASGQRSEYLKYLQDTGDKMGYIDILNYDKLSNIKTLLHYSGLSKVNESLDDLLNNTTREDFEKSNFPISYDEYVNEIEKTREYAKNLQTKMDNLNTKFENPFKVDYYKEGSEEWEQARIGYVAYEQAKDEILFQELEMEDALNRADSIGNHLNEKTPLNKTPYNSIKLLTNVFDINNEISNLSEELKNVDTKIEGKLDPEIKKNIDIKRNKLNELEDLRKTIFQCCTKKSVNEDTSELNPKLKKYIKDLVNESGDIMPNDSQIAALAEDVIDANNLRTRSHIAAQLANMLIDPAGFAKRVEDKQKFLKTLMDAREQEIRKSLEEFRRQTESNELMKRLHAIGVFFVPDDFEKLKNENVIPVLYQEILQLDGSSKVEELRTDSEKYEQAVEIITELYPNAKGATLATKQHVNDIDNIKGEDNRNLHDLIREYGLDLTRADGSEVKFIDLLQKVLDYINRTSDPDDPHTIRKISMIGALMERLGADDSIRIVKNQDQALKLIDGKPVIDPRYCSSEYDESYITFEDLVSRALITTVVNKELGKNEQFKNNLEALRKEAEEYIKREGQTFPSFLSIGGYDTVENFVAKALTDMNFAEMLSHIQSSVPGTMKQKTIWQKFVDIIRGLFGEHPNTVLNGINENLSQIFPSVEPIEVKTKPNGPVSPTGGTTEKPEVEAPFQFDESELSMEDVPNIEELRKDKDALHECVKDFKAIDEATGLYSGDNRVLDHSEIRNAIENKDIDFDNNYVVIHQTDKESAEKISKFGFRPSTPGLKGTAAFVSKEELEAIISSQESGHGHRHSDSIVVMQFKKEFIDKFKGTDVLEKIDEAMEFANKGVEIVSWGVRPIFIKSYYSKPIEYKANYEGMNDEEVSYTEGFERFYSEGLAHSSIYQFTKKYLSGTESKKGKERKIDYDNNVIQAFYMMEDAYKGITKEEDTNEEEVDYVEVNSANKLGKARRDAFVKKLTEYYSSIPGYTEEAVKQEIRDFDRIVPSYYDVLFWDVKSYLEYQDAVSKIGGDERELFTFTNKAVIQDKIKQIKNTNIRSFFDAIVTEVSQRRELTAENKQLQNVFRELLRRDYPEGSKVEIENGALAFTVNGKIAGDIVDKVILDGKAYDIREFLNTFAYSVVNVHSNALDDINKIEDDEVIEAVRNVNESNNKDISEAIYELESEYSDGEIVELTDKFGNDVFGMKHNTDKDRFMILSIESEEALKRLYDNNIITFDGSYEDLLEVYRNNPLLLRYDASDYSPNKPQMLYDMSNDFNCK